MKSASLVIFVASISAVLTSCADRGKVEAQQRAIDALSKDVVRLTQANASLEVRIESMERLIAASAKGDPKAAQSFAPLPSSRVVDVAAPTPVSTMPTGSATTYTAPASPAPSRNLTESPSARLAPIPPPEPHRSSGPQVIVVGSGSRGNAVATDSVIESHCTARWGSDFRMRAYCQDQQHEALDKLSRRTASTAAVSMSDFDAIRSQCAQRWPDDYTMRDYCEEQQIDGWKKVH